MLLLSLLIASPGLIDGTVLAQGDARPLRVAVTVPDLGSLVREIGGDEVAVTVFAKGTEDLHTIEAKPSFIKTLSEAELFIHMGMEMELGWGPVLQQGARNARVLPGARGFLDASTVITPLEVPSGQVDRSMGDVHPELGDRERIGFVPHRCDINPTLPTTVREFVSWGWLVSTRTGVRRAGGSVGPWKGSVWGGWRRKITGPSRAANVSGP